MDTQRCFRKKFPSLEAAKAAAYSMSVRQQKHVMPEPCSRCGCYHLRTK